MAEMRKESEKSGRMRGYEGKPENEPEHYRYFARDRDPDSDHKEERNHGGECESELEARMRERKD
jgi:hypothetical protein